MSEFKVDVRKVIGIEPHFNAEKLEIIKVNGLAYTIISAKGNYNIDDLVVVFQSDAVLPEDLIEYFKLNFLHKGNRVKEVKLRGVISQALVLPFTEIEQYAVDKNNETLRDKISSYQYFYENNYIEACNNFNFSEELNVIKYEPPITFQQGNAKGSLPINVERYDLENAERNPDYFEELLKEVVVVSEKLEGTNISIHVDVEGEVHVCSRSLNLKEDSDGIYWKVAKQKNLHEIVKLIQKDWFETTNEWTSVTLRGELIGQNIQGNIYGIEGHEIYLFDIKFGQNYADSGVLYSMCRKYGLLHAPIVFRGNFSQFANTLDDLKTVSDGYSILNDDVLREGIVIRPVKEKMIRQGSTRLILKQRSPEYLSK